MASPIIDEETTNDTAKPAKSTQNADSPESSYTYLLSALVIVIVIGLLYHSYSCYCANQDLFDEPEGFIEKTIKNEPNSDLAFDMDNQVKVLIMKQEQYLAQLNKR